MDAEALPTGATASSLHAPIFLVGALRSGTTMFRLMLTHHRSIHFWGEFEYAVCQARGNSWPDLPDFLQWAETDRDFINARLQIDKTLTYPELIRSFVAQHVARTDKPFFGATVHSRFDLLPELWPDARFIHLLRDPRDVARSVVQMGWAGHPFYSARHWVDVERRWDGLAKVVPAAQRFELRYENLVRRPAAELTRVCAFLGLPYDPGMPTYDRNSAYALPDPALIEQWRSKLTRREVALVEIACDDLLAERGYVPVNVPAAVPGALERLQLAAVDRFNKTAFAINKLGWSLWTQRYVARHIGTREWNRRLALEINLIEERNLK